MEGQQETEAGWEEEEGSGPSVRTPGLVASHRPTTPAAFLGENLHVADLRLVKGHGAVPVSVMAVKMPGGREGGSGYSSSMAWEHHSCRGAGRPQESSGVRSEEL